MNIAEGVDRLHFPAGLFRWHPGWRSKEFTLPGEREIHAARLRPCRQTEIRHLGNTLTAHQDVPGLEVSVHHPLLMRVPHPRTDPRKDAQPFPQRRIRPLQPPVESLAIDQFHRQPQPAVGFPTVKNRHHVLMRKRTKNLRLTRKALHRKPLPPIRSKHLDGHIPPHRLLIRLPHHRRPPAPQIPMHGITRNLRLPFQWRSGIFAH